jgi:hypothetical protein
MAARWSLASSRVAARLGIGLSFITGYRFVMEGDTTLRPPRRLPLMGLVAPRSLDQAQKLDRSLCTTRHSQLPRPMKMTVGAVVTMTQDKWLDSIKRERKHR